jgi:hypothetical protein
MQHPFLSGVAQDGNSLRRVVASLYASRSSHVILQRQRRHHRHIAESLKEFVDQQLHTFDTNLNSLITQC